jgi:hypothetical protein
MAEKHKSKYKAPKDLEKSQKPKARKDLKDYTHDDKKGALNPKSTGEKQSNVLRKTDKEMVDDGKYDVKYNADDRLYKDLEDAEYDPKHAAKVFKKRQDKDEQDNEKNIQDKIENLTREGKERLVREYVRRKIVKILKEADEPETPETESPDTVATDDIPTDTTSTDTAAADSTMASPELTTPPAATPEPTSEPAVTPTEPVAAEPVAAETQPTPEELENRVITNAANELAKEGSIGKIKNISKILKLALKDTDPEDQANFYKLLRAFAIKKIASTNIEATNKE